MAGANILCALIAAGMSTRFGSNKLEAMMGQKMLGTIAAQALRDADVGDCIAVTRAQTTDLNEQLMRIGYRLITNENPQAGMSHSIALAAQAAVNVGADALLLCLADMPFVPVDSFRALAQTFERRSLCATDGKTRMPPAIFPRDSFSALMLLTGEGGARRLLESATTLYIAPERLIDIDTQDDLAAHSNMTSQK